MIEQAPFWHINCLSLISNRLLPEAASVPDTGGAVSFGDQDAMPFVASARGICRRLDTMDKDKGGGDDDWKR
jgi:hypothetical protein